MPLFRRATCVLALCLVPGVARAVVIRPDLVSTDRWVTRMTTSGGRLFIVGNFAHVGQPLADFAIVDTATAAVRQSPIVAGRVLAAEADGNGGFFIGGEFTTVGGQPRSHLAHVQADGSVGAWDPGTDGIVTSVALSQGRLYVGGAFTSVGGVTRAYVAALDPITGVVLGWSPAVDGPVQLLIARGQSVYFSAQLPPVAGVPMQELGAADAITGERSPFRLRVARQVNALEVRDTVAYFGGVFDSVAGVPRRNIAAVGIPSGVPMAWAPSTNPQGGPHATPPSVIRLVAHGGRIYLGGTFQEIDGQPRCGVASVDLVTGSLTSWEPGGPCGVADAYDFAFDRANVFIAGAGLASHGACEADTLTGTIGSWNPHALGPVTRLVLSGGGVALLGPLLMMEPRERAGLAAIDLDSGTLLDWAPVCDRGVISMVAADTVVYLGGEFTQVNGVPRQGIAAVSANTGAVLPWDPFPIPSPNTNTTWALAVNRNLLYAGMQSGTQQVLLALDRGPAADTVWAQDPNKAVLALLASDTVLYAGGGFDSIGGLTRSGMAALDPTTGAVRGWAPLITQSPPLDLVVSAIAVQDDHVFFSGGFTAVNGPARHGLAAVDASTGATLPWAPDLRAVIDPGDSVANITGLEVSGRRLYASGTLRAAGDGFESSGLAAVDTRTGGVLAWAPGLDNIGTATLAIGPYVYAAGQFFRVQGEVRSGLVALDSADVATPEPPPGTAVGHLLRSQPNPFQTSVSLAFDVPHAGRLRLAVYDLQGRRLAMLADEDTASGPRQWSWDGRANGRRLDAGLYFLHAELDGQSYTHRIVLVP